ncbi:uncharacterized protein LOC119434060 isoform X1 [Dermacentor silvarum]|uniref:uncharacterized protein LOC119434060 isoform X1 n=1 Tax=Dermacentor silvarum TaxID=543639 RepID=UPI0021007F91|nr:uncharacterized protein LOC119434060 isoform X1 [Dermacentor silvarum]
MGLRLDTKFRSAWSWVLGAVFRASPGATRSPPSQLKQESVQLRSRAVVRGSPGTTRRPPSQQECVELRSRAVVRGSPGTTRRPPSQQVDCTRQISPLPGC